MCSVAGMNMESPSIEFAKVALVARRENGMRSSVSDTVLAAANCLREHGVQVFLEEHTAASLPKDGVGSAQILSRQELAQACDLVVVVGGDGSLLGIAREVAIDGVPVTGINRGGLGFLAGISPDLLHSQLAAILQGRYAPEDHFLLHARTERGGQLVASSPALNDVVVHPGSMARMIEFELWIDGEYVYDQRSDGLIVASPTGSTAYSLSAGGPIMHPELDAIVIVPMFPHTLTSRPLVVRGDSEIRIKVLRAQNATPQVSCDSQVNVDLEIGDEIVINKFANPLKLVYPTGHSFYESCRSKLDWASRLGGAKSDA